MTEYIPTLGARETGKNIRSFVKENMSVFWSIWKPLIPFVITFSLLDTIIGALYFSDSGQSFGLFSILSMYLYATLIITWHRVIIHGPNNFTPMNPLKPKRHEWGFIGMWLLLFLGPVFMIIVLTSMALPFGPTATGIMSLISVIAAIFIGLRLLFILPAKALNHTVTLKEAFQLSKGYLWKFMGAAFFAGIIMTLLMSVYLTIAAILGGMGIQALFGANVDSLTPKLILYAITLPIEIYFMPLITIIGVTALSNYYRLATEKTVSPRAASSSNQ